MSQGRHGNQSMLETEPGHITGQSHQKFNMLIEEMMVRVMTTGRFRNLQVPRVMNGPLVRAVGDVRVEEVRKWMMERLL